MGGFSPPSSSSFFYHMEKDVTSSSAPINKKSGSMLRAYHKSEVIPIIFFTNFDDFIFEFFSF